jgi:hypothetical protein
VALALLVHGDTLVPYGSSNVCGAAGTLGGMRGRLYLVDCRRTSARNAGTE